MGSGQTQPAPRDLDDRLVRRLIAEQFPRWAGLPARAVLAEPG
ncbi:MULTISPECIES: hypothetical protein [unclassified Streptomyces]|nr:hypothetical protein [Streptomyces sp. NBC_00334]